MFNEEIKNQLSDILGGLDKAVNIIYFTQGIECSSCKDTRNFVEEISSLSPKVNLKIHDFLKNPKEVEKYHIDKIPAIAIADHNENDYGIRFFGIPGGYEVNSFLGALLEISGKKEKLANIIEKRIKAINTDIHIQVFVTLGCPYCPNAVSTAHRLALENKNIRADMVESSTFPELTIKYAVSGVPKIIINETHELVGAQPIENFMDVIERIQHISDETVSV